MKHLENVPPDNRSQISSSSRSYCILLAEDDFEMRKMLAWSLKREGYEVVECTSGTELMEKLGLLELVPSAQVYDLIISDIRMPGQTGLEVFETLSEFLVFPPIMLLTAFPDEKIIKRSEQLGAAAILAKPFEIDDFIAKVREITLSYIDHFHKLFEISAKDIPSLPFPLTITFRHKSGSEAVREYIRRVAAKLIRFSEHIEHARVVVDELNPSEHKKHRYQINIDLKTSGKTITTKHQTDEGKSSGENLYLGIHMAFGTACRQLKNYLRKRHAKGNHRHGTLNRNKER